MPIKINNTLYQGLIFGSLIIGFFNSCRIKLDNTAIELPMINYSEDTLKSLILKKDTIESWYKLAGRNSLLLYDSIGNFSVLNTNIGLALKYSWVSKTPDTTSIEVFPEQKFNRSVSWDKNKYLYSQIIGDSGLYIIYHNQLIWYDIKKQEYAMKEELNEKLFALNKTKYYCDASSFNGASNILFDNKNLTVYFPVYTLNQKERRFLAAYHLKSRRLEILDIPYPHYEYSLKRVYQNHFMPILINNKMNISFVFSGLNLKYDIFNKQIDTINLTSTSDTISDIIYSYKNTKIKDVHERWGKEYMYNSHYANFTYNKNKKHFYKIFYKSMPENRPDGLKNSFEDKKCVLQVFDNNLKVLKEINLPYEIFYISMIIPTKSGLQIYYPLNSENTLSKNKYSMRLNISYD
jgi:hypothetical protein